MTVPPIRTTAKAKGWLPWVKKRAASEAVIRQPRIPGNALPGSLLSNDSSDVSGLVLSLLDDVTLPSERRTALAEEFLKQGGGDRVPPAALVEWFVAAQRVLRAIDGTNGADAVEPSVVDAVRWWVVHFAARAGLVADCREAMDVALEGSVGTTPVPAARLTEIIRWQVTQPSILELLLRALEPNAEPEAVHSRQFLRDLLTRQASKSGRAPSSRPMNGIHHA